MAVYTDWAGARAGDITARTVARYNELIQQLADRARQTGSSRAAWDELGEVVDTAQFRRFGNFMEEQDWGTYADMLHQWGSVTPFSSAFRRLTVDGRLAFLELQENNAGHIVNSLSLYELDDADRIVRLRIFLQMKPA